MLTTHIRRLQDYCYQYEPTREFVGGLELLTLLVEEMQAANTNEMSSRMRRPKKSEAKSMQNRIIMTTK